MGMVTIPNGQKLSPELIEQLKKDLENPIRKLSQEERSLYGKAVSKAVLFLPAFRDAIALMRPFMDATASTAYTDPYARVGLGYWFFYILDDAQRASVILHECMHVLNNHFQRAAEVKSLRANQMLFNLAGDFEINTVLNRVAFVDLKDGQLPDREPHSYPPMKTMEIYADLLYKDQKEKEDKCEVHGKEAKEKKREEDKKKQEAADQKSKEDAEKQDSDSGDDSDKGDQDSDEAGDQPSDQGQPSDEGDGQDGTDGDGDGDQEGEGDSQSGSGSQPGGSQTGNQHGNSGPKCTCGKDDADGDEDGDGQGQGQGNGQGKPGQGSGKGQPGQNGPESSWGCGEATEDRQDAADEAGIQRASDVEQTIAKANTAARIVDQKNSGGRGTGHMDEFWDSILQHLLPKKVDWRKIFRQILTQSSEAVVRGRQNYTYRRVSRRLTGGQFVFPGMVNYLPKVTLAIDTSGSMGNEDYQRALNEIEGIVKEVAKGKDSLSIFSVDTKVGNVQPVSSVKKIRLHGGGGTQMAVAWQYINTVVPKKKVPDIFILSTDGFIDWADVEREVRASKFKSVILVTQEAGFKSAPESLKKIIPVLCIDEAKK